MGSDLTHLLQTEAEHLPAFDMLAWAIDRFGRSGIAFATSLGAEDQVITDMLMRIDPHVRLFTLDTGMLPPETLDLLWRTEDHYGIKIQVVRPDAAAVDEMVRRHGAGLYWESVEKRRLCCHVRKVEPLTRTLAGLKAWICGLRREQAVTRQTVAKIEWDSTFGLHKINPLVDWTTLRVWDFIRRSGIPFNALHDQGYASIGCAPCTRAVNPGEDIRGGRWWWETPEHRECGLHIRDGRLIPGGGGDGSS